MDPLFTPDALLRHRWFPVARSEEAVKRCVLWTQLLGQEIAIWRDDAGLVNAWENRCPHRGVRLSIGLNLGHELRCQYHGWRYASGSGECVRIPAHPDMKPPATIRATPYGATEHCGFIWVCLSGVTGAVPELPVTSPLTLRSIFIEAPLGAVTKVLAPDHRLVDDFMLADRHDEKTILFLHPVTERQTLLHGLIDTEAADSERIALLRTHNARMTELRDRAEAGRGA